MTLEPRFRNRAPWREGDDANDEGVETRVGGFDGSRRDTGRDEDSRDAVRCWERGSEDVGIGGG